jgi:hypothetical protein
MKVRWAMAATLVAVVVAPLALVGTAFAQTSQTGQVLHINETYVDPYWSSTCGFDVVEHDVGVIRSTLLPNNRAHIQQSGRTTLTNPETGTSVSIRTAGTFTTSFKAIDENGSFSITTTFTGLDYKVLGADGAVLSAGRGVETLTLIFDENGNFVDIRFGESATPNLEHLFGSRTEASICRTLAQ